MCWSRRYLRNFCWRDVATKHDIILVGKDGLGDGDDKLGQLIIANFFRLLGEKEEKPGIIIFWNNGVKLLLEDSTSLGHLKKLSGQGVKLIACITCLEYFGIEDKIQAGEPAPMMKIQDLLLAHNVLTV